MPLSQIADNLCKVMMPASNKRPFPEPDFDSSLPSKRARQDTQQDSSSVEKLHSRPSVTPSSPTLIGSVPTTPPRQILQSSQTEETDSETSSYASSLGIPGDTEETTSSDESSDISDQAPSLGLQWQRLLAAQVYSDSTSTSSSGESFSSTSASISDELSSSSVSTSSGSDEEDDDLSPSASSSTSDSPNRPPPSTETLTAKNLSKLQQRLNSLLPRLQSANEQLEMDRKAGKLGERNIENVEEDGDGGEKGYIEMNLGLGVLEEKGDGKAEEVTEQDGSDSDSFLEEKSQQSLKEDAIARLLGKAEEKTNRKVHIEDVDSG